MTDGKGAERPFVSTFLDPGDTGVVDLGYVAYRRFDAWIKQDKHFVARLRKNAQREILEYLPIPPRSAIFFFAKIRLGEGDRCMHHPLYMVGFKFRGKIYWIVTDREDLSAEQIAFIFFLSDGR